MNYSASFICYAIHGLDALGISGVVRLGYDTGSCILIA